MKVKEEKIIVNKRTNITVKKENVDLWAWAFGRAKQLGKPSVSDYVFSLIQQDKEKTEIGRKN